MKSKLSRMVAIITDEKFLKPINLEEEKAKVLKDQSYDPQFIYPKIDYPTDSFRKDLEQMLLKPQNDDKRVSLLIQERVRELILWIDLMKLRGSTGAAIVSNKLFGIPLPRHILVAKDWLKEQSNPLEKNISTEKVLEQLSKEVKKLDDEWSAILLPDLQTRVSVNSLKKELKVRAGELFSEEDVRKLIVHEIQTHVQRSVNGSKQEHDIFESGTAQYLETEEGLAVFNEQKANLLLPASKKYIALKVMSIYWALNEPFHVVYQRLLEYLPPERAFRSAYRSKRGISNTSQPGAFSKDLIYMSGYLKVSSLSEQDRTLLYCGKISVNHLPIIKELIKEGVVHGPSH